MQSSISRVDGAVHSSSSGAFMDPKQTIQAFVDAINSQDWIRLDSLVATDFVRHSIAAGEPPVRSRADLVRFLRHEFETFPDAQEMILDIFAEGEKVAVRHHFRGAQYGLIGSYLPTGKTMNAEYIAIYRVRNGQILEAWAEWDNLAGLKQLGHL
jgi:predicted ester cyclase